MNLRRHSQRIYSPPPLPLGTLSHARSEPREFGVFMGRRLRQVNQRRHRKACKPRACIMHDIAAAGLYGPPLSLPEECSSIGRAPVSKTGGCRFEPCHSCQAASRAEFVAGERLGGAVTRYDSMRSNRSGLADAWQTSPFKFLQEVRDGDAEGHLAVAQGNHDHHRDGVRHGRGRRRSSFWSRIR